MRVAQGERNRHRRILRVGQEHACRPHRRPADADRRPDPHRWRAAPRRSVLGEWQRSLGYSADDVSLSDDTIRAQHRLLACRSEIDRAAPSGRRQHGAQAQSASSYVSREAGGRATIPSWAIESPALRAAKEAKNRLGAGRSTANRKSWCSTKPPAPWTMETEAAVMATINELPGRFDADHGRPSPAPRWSRSTGSMSWTPGASWDGQLYLPFPSTAAGPQDLLSPRGGGRIRLPSAF